jgi:molecular chaperone HtpG
MFGMGNMPEMYNLVVNTNSELATASKQQRQRRSRKPKTSARLG